LNRLITSDKNFKEDLNLLMEKTYLESEDLAYICDKVGKTENDVRPSQEDNYIY